MVVVEELPKFEDVEFLVELGNWLNMTSSLVGDGT